MAAGQGRHSSASLAYDVATRCSLSHLRKNLLASFTVVCAFSSIIQWAGIRNDAAVDAASHESQFSGLAVAKGFFGTERKNQHLQLALYDWAPASKAGAVYTRPQ